MSEWKEVKLGDLITIKYGKDHKKLKDGNIPVYGSGGIMRYVDSQLYDKPSLLLPRKGSLNNIFYTDSAFWTVDTMFWSTIDEDKVNPKFLYYSMFKKDLSLLNIGTSIPSLSVQILNDIDLTIPDLPTQQRIASILSSLDAKIENNNKINAKLEEIAQNLFKEWFVDFGPFKNGKFVDSELGLIPEGWRVGKIEDFGDIVCGKTPSKEIKEYYGNGVNFIKIPDMHGNPFVINSEDSLSELGSQSQIKKLLPAFSILVSCIATVGLVSMNSEPAHTNQQINSIVPYQKEYTFYLYLTMKSLNQKLKDLGSGGTATLNVNTKVFSNINILYPSAESMKQFDKVIKPLFETILYNTKESQRLSTLRDTLLPKLMSGEIEV